MRGRVVSNEQLTSRNLASLVLSSGIRSEMQAPSQARRTTVAMYSSLPSLWSSATAAAPRPQASNSYLECHANAD